MFGNQSEIQKRYEEVIEKLGDPDVFSDQATFRKLSREHKQLTPVIQAFTEYQKLEQELSSQQEILQDPTEDPEIKAMAEQEVPELKASMEVLGEKLKLLLVPKDPLDDADIVLEIRAGTGGDEAALFAADLYRMYQRFSEQHQWKVDLLSASYSDGGGFKEVVLGVEGDSVYRQMKYESGVHRVQRVPQTESQGRIHTSAATVAVLPESEEEAVEVNTADLRIDVFRASGPGGQSVNTTDSAVRITHVPTGVVAQSQDEKSQHKNKAKALKVLQARLQEKAREEQQSREASQRRSMVGSGDRSERVRTYNYPQGRLTDHRIGLTLYRLEQIMEGDLGEVVEALMRADQEEKLAGGKGT